VPPSTATLTRLAEATEESAESKSKGQETTSSKAETDDSGEIIQGDDLGEKEENYWAGRTRPPQIVTVNEILPRSK